jgi:hypothetical protein
MRDVEETRRRGLCPGIYDMLRRGSRITPVDFSKKEALHYAQTLEKFYIPAWKALFGI